MDEHRVDRRAGQVQAPQVEFGRRAPSDSQVMARLRSDLERERMRVYDLKQQIKALESKAPKVEKPPPGEPCPVCRRKMPGRPKKGK